MRIDWRRLFYPSAWIQIYRTDWDWDAKLNDLMDNYPPVHGDYGFCVTFDSTKVWVNNYPYGYGSEVWHGGVRKSLPSVNTRIRLKRLLDEVDK